MDLRNRSNPTKIIRTLPPHGEPVDVSDRVFDMTYEEEEKKADKLTLKVENYDLRNFDNPVFAKGVILEVRWGYPGNMSPARECVIQKITGSQILQVEALDKGILMNKDTKSRTFDRVTRSDVAKKIAAEEGYDDTHIETTTHVYDCIVQPRMTNAQFMKSLAKCEGFEFYIDFDGLHWHRKNMSQAPAGELVWFADRTGTLIDFQITNDVTAKPAAIVHKGRDPMKKEDFTVGGDDASTKRTGSAILEAIDPRHASTYDKAAPAGTAITSPTTEPNATAAKVVVDGQFRQAQITIVELDGKAIGDPSFVAKTMREIKGLLSLSGNYYVTAAKHSLPGAGGYVVDFKAKRDGRDKPIPDVVPIPSKAATNTLEAGEKDQLQPIDKIDPRHATTKTTTFVDTRGRASKE